MGDCTHHYKIDSGPPVKGWARGVCQKCDNVDHFRTRPDALDEDKPIITPTISTPTIGKGGRTLEKYFELEARKEEIIDAYKNRAGSVSALARKLDIKSSSLKGKLAQWGVWEPVRTLKGIKKGKVAKSTHLEKAIPTHLEKVLDDALQECTTLDSFKGFWKGFKAGLKWHSNDVT